MIPKWLFYWAIWVVLMSPVFVLLDERRLALRSVLLRSVILIAALFAGTALICWVAVAALDRLTQ